MEFIEWRFAKSFAELIKSVAPADEIARCDDVIQAERLALDRLGDALRKLDMGAEVPADVVAEVNDAIAVTEWANLRIGYYAGCMQVLDEMHPGWEKEFSAVIYPGK